MLECFSALWASIHASQIPFRGPAIVWKARYTALECSLIPESVCSRPLTIHIGVYKRGITLGIVIGWGNLNGIVSSNLYRGSDAPRFYPGHGTVLAYLTLFLFGGSVIQYSLLRKENKKRQRGDRDHWTQGLTPLQIQQCGDMRPDFIYTL